MNRVSSIVAMMISALLSAPLARAESTLFERDSSPSSKVSLGGKRLSVARLNRQTFAGNVLKEEDGFAEHWVVLFCVDWYPPCQALQTHYEGLAAKYSKAFNNDTGVLRDFVKFATVDCAVDKVLCNEEEVETYPTVTLYNLGETLAVWTGGSEARDAKSFSNWLDKELTSFKAISLTSVPLLSKRERAMVMRLLALLAASLSLFVWAVGRGGDLWLVMSARRDAEKKERKAAEKDTLKEGGTGPVAPESGLAQRLPREWAADRGSIEL